MTSLGFFERNSKSFKQEIKYILEYYYTMENELFDNVEGQIIRSNTILIFFMFLAIIKY
jgi:hypothetical protein